MILASNEYNESVQQIGPDLFLFFFHTQELWELKGTVESIMEHSGCTCTVLTKVKFNQRLWILGVLT